MSTQQLRPMFVRELAERSLKGILAKYRSSSLNPKQSVEDLLNTLSYSWGRGKIELSPDDATLAVDIWLQELSRTSSSNIYKYNKGLHQLIETFPVVALAHPKFPQIVKEADELIGQRKFYPEPGRDIFDYADNNGRGYLVRLCQSFGNAAQRPVEGTNFRSVPHEKGSVYVRSEALGDVLVVDRMPISMKSVNEYLASYGPRLVG